MIKFIKKQYKKLGLFSLMLMALVMGAIPAGAVGTADSTVTTAFTGMKDDVIATLGVVAGLAVAVMAVFLAWKYGRKIFNQVAK